MHDFPPMGNGILRISATIVASQIANDVIVRFLVLDFAQMVHLQFLYFSYRSKVGRVLDWLEKYTFTIKKATVLGFSNR
jgi:hypothetical protein